MKIITTEENDYQDSHVQLDFVSDVAAKGSIVEKEEHHTTPHHQHHHLPPSFTYQVSKEEDFSSIIFDHSEGNDDDDEKTDNVKDYPELFKKMMLNDDDDDDDDASDDYAQSEFKDDDDNKSWVSTSSSTAFQPSCLLGDEGSLRNTLWMAVYRYYNHTTTGGGVVAGRGDLRSTTTSAHTTTTEEEDVLPFDQHQHSSMIIKQDGYGDHRSDHRSSSNTNFFTPPRKVLLLLAWICLITGSMLLMVAVLLPSSSTSASTAQPPSESSNTMVDDNIATFTDGDYYQYGTAEEASLPWRTEGYAAVEASSEQQQVPAEASPLPWRAEDSNAGTESFSSSSQPPPSTTVPPILPPWRTQDPQPMEEGEHHNPDYLVNAAAEVPFSFQYNIHFDGVNGFTKKYTTSLRSHRHFFDTFAKTMDPITEIHFSPKDATTTKQITLSTTPPPSDLSSYSPNDYDLLTTMIVDHPALTIELNSNGEMWLPLDVDDGWKENPKQRLQYYPGDEFVLKIVHGNTNSNNNDINNDNGNNDKEPEDDTVHSSTGRNMIRLFRNSSNTTEMKLIGEWTNPTPDQNLYGQVWLKEPNSSIVANAFNDNNDDDDHEENDSTNMNEDDEDDEEDTNNENADNDNDKNEENGYRGNFRKP